MVLNNVLEDIKTNGDASTETRNLPGRISEPRLNPRRYMFSGLALFLSNWKIEFGSRTREKKALLYLTDVSSKYNLSYTKNIERLKFNFIRVNSYKIEFKALIMHINNQKINLEFKVNNVCNIW